MIKCDAVKCAKFMYTPEPLYFGAVFSRIMYDYRNVKAMFTHTHIHIYNIYLY